MPPSMDALVAAAWVNFKLRSVRAVADSDNGCADGVRDHSPLTTHHSPLALVTISLRVRVARPMSPQRRLSLQ